MGSWRSDLSDDIIHRIISNPTFTNKDAIQLSLVSKEFLGAVQRRSVLVFKGNNDHSFKDKELEYVISTLARYYNEGIRLDTLKLLFSYDDPPILMEQCIQLAAAKNLGLRNLKLWMPRSDKRFVLTQSIFHVKSLVELDFYRFDLQQRGSMVITWPNLKRLRLHDVDMEERVFENIIRSCPLIESLKIVISCSNISKFNLKAFNLGYLKKLSIRFCTNQTFDLGTAAPNLECLDLTPSNLQIDLSRYDYHKLKSLSLELYWTKAFNGDFLINLAHQFPVLEELSIKNTNLENINISSPSLKKIKLEGIKGLQEASFDVPNIVLFTFMYNINIPKLSFVGNLSGWTSCIKFRIENDSTDMSTSWLLKLKEFLAAINMSEASTGIDFWTGVAFYINIEARAQKPADSDASFPRINQCLNMGRIHPNQPFSLPFDTEILYDILLMFRPQKLILNWQDCEFPKALYDHLMLTRFDNVWNVTQIDMQSLTLHQVSDRKKFLEMFKGVFGDVQRRFWRCFGG